VNTSNTTAAIDKALAEFQAEVANPPKSRTARVPTKSGGEYKYNYADLGDIINAVRPIMAKHGLSAIQPTLTGEGSVGCMTRLGHTSGEWMLSDPFTIPAANATPQTIGGYVTYARRYSLAGMLGIATEDDDDAGHAEQQAKEAIAQRQAAKPFEYTNAGQPQPQTPQNFSPKSGSQPAATSSNADPISQPTKRLVYKLMQDKGVIGPYIDAKTPAGKERLNIASEWLTKHVGKSRDLTELDGLLAVDILQMMESPDATQAAADMFGAAEVQGDPA